MKKEENLHEKHRERVRERFIKHGFETFDEHVMLETLLFYTIRQKDTNPIAHRLINKFGSIKGVLMAKYDELISVHGVGKASATFLMMIGSLYRIIEKQSSLENNEPISVEYVGKYAAKMLKHEQNEVTLLIYIKNNCIIESKIASKGSKRGVLFDRTDMIRRALELSCDMIAVAHNHPNGTLTPSVDDYRTFFTTNTLAENMNVHLFEYFIVNGNAYYPMILSGDTENTKL